MYSDLDRARQQFQRSNEALAELERISPDGPNDALRHEALLHIARLRLLHRPRPRGRAGAKRPRAQGMRGPADEPPVLIGANAHDPLHRPMSGPWLAIKMLCGWGH